ncbi:hypothetical protein N8T08_002531 [Aspergillus melleus]|uniref:Uncharacterized protein n=1 Tax=Aspergillus melleus TaxID=138277 RepID=A0ACC3B8I4_9EURO|nr:hypothetical protein N8T08_002531 [Aspergillus melleus]
MAEEFQFPAFGGIASESAQWLQDAGVSAVQFWQGMERAYTGESSSSMPLFVVPDHLVDMAADALGQRPLPDEHFHNLEDPEQILLLLEQSKFPWAVPGLPLGLVDFDNPYFKNTDNP